MNLDLARHDGDRRFLWFMVALAALLRFFYIGHQSMWVDELNTINVATPSHGFSVWKIALHNIHGPVPTLFLYIWKLFGNADWWLRLPSALAGCAGVVTFFLWLRRWLGAPVARIATILLTISPLHIHYSQEVRNYAFVFLLATLAGYLFERWLANSERRGSIRYGLSLGIAFLCNFSAAFFFAAQSLVYFLREKVSGRAIRRWLIVCLVIIVVASPWIYRVYTILDVGRLVTPVKPGEIQTTERLRGETTVSFASVPYTFYVFSVGFTLGPSMRELHDDAQMKSTLRRHAPIILVVTLVFGALAILGLISAVRRKLRWGEILLHLLIPLSGVIALNWQNAKVFNVRYVLLALPAYLAVVSIGIESLRPRWRHVALGAVMLLCFLSIANYYFNGAYAKADVRAATNYANAHMTPDECIFAPTVWHVVERYQKTGVPVKTIYRTGMKPERVDELMTDVFAGCNSMWYVRARPWVLDWDNYIIDNIMQNYEVLQEVEFNGVILFHLGPKKSM